MPDRAPPGPDAASAPAGTERGRDGCRVPMPWAADAPSCGFGPSDQTWLPQPAALRRLRRGPAGRRARARRSSSTARCCATRRDRALGTGSLTWVRGLRRARSSPSPSPRPSGGERTLVLANLGAAPGRAARGRAAAAVPRPARRTASSRPTRRSGLAGSKDAPPHLVLCRPPTTPVRRAVRDRGAAGRVRADRVPDPACRVVTRRDVDANEVAGVGPRP